MYITYSTNQTNFYSHCRRVASRNENRVKRGQRHLIFRGVKIVTFARRYSLETEHARTKSSRTGENKQKTLKGFVNNT